MNYHIILASNSPRRRQLLASLDIPFEVKVLPSVSESYPEGLPPEEIPQHIARQKAEAYRQTMTDDQLVITADTVVVSRGKILGKPADAAQARLMLRELSGHTHHVITGCCLTTLSLQHTFAVTTAVTFKPLTDAEIDYYIDRYKPFDKAGSYGIQEWIGYIGVTHLNGSYFNVMGLPVQRIYTELKEYFHLQSF